MRDHWSNGNTMAMILQADAKEQESSDGIIDIATDQECAR
jgi:hypothetical protein